MSDGHPDAYRTLVAEAEGELRDRGSRFIACAAHCPSRAALDQHVSASRRAHPGARHHCAGAVFAGDPTPVAQDDGEPSGTAGLPIANRILAAGLADVGIVVVRYFGGTLLGRPGLVKAYGGAAALALANGRAVTRYHQRPVRLNVAYPRLSQVMRVLEGTPGLDVVERAFGAACVLDVAVPRSAVRDILALADHTGEVQADCLDE